ncbi:N utilization substance protein A [Dehalogenimonas formicexedens]|uniref:Transcription termination/antitermination protein NusA n=1 Tax=Dehalogenimonas formicexedens TaxID=1839801 RepID=A0A1P8F7U3_9CHLR|nr:transcription termination factor NusA [Dehalogenimonas formicexedens]APV44544.1 N utilization substance protein A [Dehalogenimonas formicexedens]
MKSDFMLAITQLSAEKNLSKEVVLAAVEAALVSAYRKESFAPNQNIQAKIDPATGRVKVWAEKTVVEKVEDPRKEITLAEAKRVQPGIQLGEPVVVEATPADAGRIAAQTAKQVILQRLHEAENTAIVDEYAGKAGDIVSGVIQRIEPKQIIVDLGRAEAVMPLQEQVHTERYRPGQRIRAYLVEVAKGIKGPTVVLSRSHPGLLRRLFEMEIPEIFSGMVEIKSVAREAGARSKVAVAARQTGIDPVGCCVGLRGIRIQNIVSELSGEKIDVVAWSPDPAVFIASALSPAQVVRVILSESDKSATAVIPDRQQSLAIGKEGQNVRLAVKLTGWRIDIKSVSDYEAAHPVVTPEAVVRTPEVVTPAAVEKAPEKPVEKAAEKTPVKHIEKPEKPVEAAPAAPAAEPVIPEPVAAAAPVAPGPVEEEVGLKLSLNAPERAPVGAGSKSGVRFAEDILGRSGDRGAEKKKRKGKDDEGGRGKKKRSGGAGEFDTDEYD